MPLDNSALVAPFIPEIFDGDTFLYTELLNRAKKSGNNKGRIVKTYYHRDRVGFFEQFEGIRALCDFYKVRACTRLSARSFQAVGQALTKLIVEQALTANWQGMRHAYSKACGQIKPTNKIWLFDIDNRDQLEMAQPITQRLEYVCTIPSRKGWHVITRPFDTRELKLGDIQLHKDNPTNLYIPDEAA